MSDIFFRNHSPLQFGKSKKRLLVTRIDGLKTGSSCLAGNLIHFYTRGIRIEPWWDFLFDMTMFIVNYQMALFFTAYLGGDSDCFILCIKVAVRLIGIRPYDLPSTCCVRHDMQFVSCHTLNLEKKTKNATLRSELQRRCWKQRS
jgi:hypothetical protein